MAREWARRISADRELVEALGSEAARLTLRQVVEGDLPRRNPLPVPDERRWQVNWWPERLGEELVTDIRPDTVRLALNEYAAGGVRVFVRGRGLVESTHRRSPASVNRLRAQLAAIHRHARHEWGLSIESPTKSVPARKELNQRKVFLTEQQAGTLLAAARDSSWPKLYLLVLLGIATGARRGSLEALRWSDIDFETRTASVPKTKNGDAPGRLPLGSQLPGSPSGIGRD